MKQAERRAQTQERLLDAAAEQFGRRGFHATTLDDVAAAAGYTKGAVYSNYAGKDELFLALLDRYVDRQVAEVDRLAATESGDALHARLLAVSQDVSSAGSFGVLMLEFWRYAARNATARAALAQRYRHLRGRLADLIGERAELGVGEPHSAVQSAAVVLALDAGLFLQQLIDPETITTELRAEAIADVIDPKRLRFR